MEFKWDSSKSLESVFALLPNDLKCRSSFLHIQLMPPGPFQVVSFFFLAFPNRSTQCVRWTRRVCVPSPYKSTRPLSGRPQKSRSKKCGKRIKVVAAGRAPFGLGRQLTGLFTEPWKRRQKGAFRRSHFAVVNFIFGAIFVSFGTISRGFVFARAERSITSDKISKILQGNATRSDN